MRRLALAAVISVVGGTIGCGGSSSSPDGTSSCSSATATSTTAVSLVGMRFAPSCVKVAKGATVTWTNTDTTNHTVTEDAGQPEPFDSGTLVPGQTYTHTFGQTPGPNDLHCRLHPSMTAIVFVE